MSQAVLCPVCNGSGNITPSVSNGSTAMPTSHTCHGCSGKGWIEIDDDSTQYVWSGTCPLNQFTYTGHRRF